MLPPPYRWYIPRRWRLTEWATTPSGSRPPASGEIDAGLLRDVGERGGGAGGENEVTGLERGRRRVDAPDGDALVEEKIDGSIRVVDPAVEGIDGRIRATCRPFNRRRHLHEIGPDRFVDRIHAHAHELNIVSVAMSHGRIGIAVPVARVGIVRISRAPQQVADDAHLRLRHRDDVGAGAVGHAAAVKSVGA